MDRSHLRLPAVQQYNILAVYSIYERGLERMLIEYDTAAMLWDVCCCCGVPQYAYRLPPIESCPA